MQKKIHIAVCDKNTADTDILIDIIKNHDLDCEIDCYADAESLLAESDINKYHLVITDVLLSGMSGLQLAREIQKLNDNCEIVFATASEEYALEAYGVNALQYLVKPLKPNDVIRTLDHFMQIMKRRSLV